MKQILVVQHVPHERLGTFEPAFKEAGCALSPLNAYDPKARWPQLSDIDGIVSMGGPMSVYEQAKYPWITTELALLREAVERGLPVLGVCLGAQLLAAALGATVTKSPQKEIGWYPLMREPGADEDPLLEPFGRTETVFQWHGDTFGLPKGAVRLASSPLCREPLASGSGFHPESHRRMEQAFRFRDNVYGLQFHLEVAEPMIRAWMRTPVNKAELASLRGVIDPMTIRHQSQHHVGRLQELSRHVATTFAKLVQGKPAHARSLTDARSR